MRVVVTNGNAEEEGVAKVMNRVSTIAKSLNERFGCGEMGGAVMRAMCDRGHVKKARCGIGAMSSVGKGQCGLGAIMDRMLDQTSNVYFWESACRALPGQSLALVCVFLLFINRALGF